MSNLKRMSYEDLHDKVILTGLCVRCGICCGVCPIQVIKINNDGYPELSGTCLPCGLCNACCPGADVDYPVLSRQVFKKGYNADSLTGEYEKCFVSYSTNEDVRKAGASGGVITGLLLHLLEKNQIDGAIVVGMDQDLPYKPIGILAKTPDEILAAASSKYCITPSMEVLRFLRNTPGRYAVVGLPCQIHGIRKLEQADPLFSNKIYCCLGLICHCNLEFQATMDALKLKKVKLSEIKNIKYRGGKKNDGFHLILKNGRIEPVYRAKHVFAMNVLFRLYGAKRCKFCYDAFAEFADLSFGEIMPIGFRNDFAHLNKHTVVFQRTRRGLEILSDLNIKNKLFLEESSDARLLNRLLGMAKEKKAQATALVAENIGKKKPFPNYNLGFRKPTKYEKRYAIRFHFYNFLRNTFFRKALLGLMISDIGLLLSYFNQFNKKIRIVFFSEKLSCNKG